MHTYLRRIVKPLDVFVDSMQQHIAAADTHTEHNQVPHVHVNSYTRSRVLHYTVVQLYTRRLILKRNTALRLYIIIIISNILAKANKSFFTTQDQTGGYFYCYNYSNYY